MTIKELKKILGRNSKLKLKLFLPDGKQIPSHFHVTEVGHVQKDFIDCGGTRRSTSVCVLQAWVAVNDEDHSLGAEKLASILKRAERFLPSDDLEVEVEFEAPYISQFPIASAKADEEAVVFQLTTKHTDCLAKEVCGVESNSSSCCDTGSGCCS